MKKSYIALILIILVSVVATRYSDTDATLTTATSYVAEAKAAALEDSESESVDESDHNWGNPHTLQDHYQRHGADFNAKNAQDYARQANAFYENRAQYQTKKQDGVLRVYDAESNTFGAYNADGSTRTFYKPTDGQAYFDRQPGS